MRHYFQPSPRILPCDRVDRVKVPLLPRDIPLHYVTFCGLHDIVMILVIECSQNVDSRFFKGERMPSDLTSQEEHVEISLFLLEDGGRSESQSRAIPRC